jgi:signal transduction histidine kinase
MAAGELTADLRKALRVTVPATLPRVRGDRASLATILTELVRNACKYSPAWVEVELTAGADAQTVWIQVTDRGLGIRPEHAERAFERFWQLDTGDQRRGGEVAEGGRGRGGGVSERSERTGGSVRGERIAERSEVMA